LSIPAPLEVGGLYFGHDRVSDLARGLGIDKLKLPYGDGFAGCMKNLTVTQGTRLTRYSLGNPSDFSDEETFKEGCDLQFAAAVMALNMNMNFLIGILVALAVILTVIIVMAVYRRRRPAFGDKDIDCDIRENIINYEDEGGGEGDMTAFDITPLQIPIADPSLAHHSLPRQKVHYPAPPMMGPESNVENFIEDHKRRADQDPYAPPFDDLRNYAYEGGGSTAGSLSSLGSDTDIGHIGPF
jgi:hypothetical protein